MIEELRLTILNRVINELFKEASDFIKKEIELTSKNKKLLTVGLCVSTSFLMHSLSNVTGVVSDIIGFFIISSFFGNLKVNNLKNEVEQVKFFYNYFNIEDEEIVDKVKRELTSDLRSDTFFTKEEINKVIDNGILNLNEEEIEMFSHIKFNDNQEQYLKELLNKKEKINVVNFLDLSMLEASQQNKKYVSVGGEGKTLKDIVYPNKKYKFMK